MPFIFSSICSISFSKLSFSVCKFDFSSSSFCICFCLNSFLASVPINFAFSSLSAIPCNIPILYSPFSFTYVFAVLSSIMILFNTLYTVSSLILESCGNFTFNKCDKSYVNSTGFSYKYLSTKSISICFMFSLYSFGMINAFKIPMSKRADSILFFTCSSKSGLKSIALYSSIYGIFFSFNFFLFSLTFSVIIGSGSFLLFHSSICSSNSCICFLILSF